MRHLLACTAIAPVLVALTVAQAAAETTIATATTNPVKTSTIANGAADDITISSAGTITLTSGTAVTVDSNNKVSNAGTITINDANDVTGILVAPGTSGALREAKISPSFTHRPEVPMESHIAPSIALTRSVASHLAG